MGFLLDVGLDYLTLDRASATLASASCTCWTSRALY